MKREDAIIGLKEIRDWPGLPYCIEEPLGKEGVSVITTELIDMAIKALEDIQIVSSALSNITNWECCDYGYTKACDIADKYIESEV